MCIYIDIFCHQINSATYLHFFLVVLSRFFIVPYPGKFASSLRP